MIFKLAVYTLHTIFVIILNIILCQNSIYFKYYLSLKFTRTV